jgi:large subunit ribosomal protein L29
MKYGDFKEMSVPELTKKRKALAQELTLNKMKNSMGQLANPLQIRFLRRDIAKVNTALTQKLSK